MFKFKKSILIITSLLTLSLSTNTHIKAGQLADGVTSLAGFGASIGLSRGLLKVLDGENGARNMMIGTGTASLSGYGLALFFHKKAIGIIYTEKDKAKLAKLMEKTSLFKRAEEELKFREKAYNRLSQEDKKRYDIYWKLYKFFAGTVAVLGLNSIANGMVYHYSKTI